MMPKSNPVTMVIGQLCISPQPGPAPNTDQN
jgi:hypothetical protein